MYDARTAAFNIGATLTGGTSGATATILNVADFGDNTGALYLQRSTVTGAFHDNEALTDNGGTPGAATAKGRLEETWHYNKTSSSGPGAFTEVSYLTSMFDVSLRPVIDLSGNWRPYYDSLWPNSGFGTGGWVPYHPIPEVGGDPTEVGSDINGSNHQLVMGGGLAPELKLMHALAAKWPTGFFLLKFDLSTTGTINDEWNVSTGADWASFASMWSTAVSRMAAQTIGGQTGWTPDLKAVISLIAEGTMQDASFLTNYTVANLQAWISAVRTAIATGTPADLGFVLWTPALGHNATTYPGSRDLMKFVNGQVASLDAKVKTFESAEDFGVLGYSEVGEDANLSHYTTAEYIAMGTKIAAAIDELETPTVTADGLGAVFVALLGQSQIGTGFTHTLLTTIDNEDWLYINAANHPNSYDTRGGPNGNFLTWDDQTETWELYDCQQNGNTVLRGDGTAGDGNYVRNQVGPEAAIFYQLSLKYPGRKICMFKAAFGASALQLISEQADPTGVIGGVWEKSAADNYAILETRMRLAIKRLQAEEDVTPDFNGIYWVQGESDALTTATAAGYFATRAGGPDIPFIVARLHKDQTINATFRDTIRAAQDAVALSRSNVKTVSLDALQFKSAASQGGTTDIHFAGHDMMQIGELMVAGFSSLVSDPTIFSDSYLPPS
jgi:hypothetical protein